MLKILEDLVLLARERRETPVEGSYTNKLLSDKNLSKDKIIEEINELLESVDQNSNKIVKSLPSGNFLKSPDFFKFNSSSSLFDSFESYLI